MEQLGFMTQEISKIPLEIINYDDGFVWDRQTVVILGDNRNINTTRQQFRSIHNPHSQAVGYGYNVDVFVNLEYSPFDKDPANRWIRIVYADSNKLSIDEIIKRFPNSYIFSMTDGKDGVIDGTSRISGEISQISCR